MNEHAIPEPLRRRDQWVVWRSEERDGRRTKVPYQADAPDEPASATDPRTWSSFEHACAGKGVAGVGYVFSADDPFTGIDLDDCIDDDGEVHPAAARILAKLDSYAERTPSGRGFHIFVEAELTGKRNRTKKTPWGGEIEAYDRARFFTVTGAGSGAIRSAQPELDELLAEFLPPPAPPKSAPRTNGLIPASDRDLLERAFAAANGAKLRALYEGDTSAYGGDDSAADRALCNMLAFWTGPSFDRIDVLFRDSGLYREKWDREDYRQRTRSARRSRLEPSSTTGTSTPTATSRTARSASRRQR